MRVVVTEKPSVARDLARVLGVSGKRDGWLEGQGIRITWCVGHLLELQEPAHYDDAWKRWSLATLPMVPDAFALRVRQGAEDQWTVVARLLADPGVQRVVNACDAGREGELIFRYAYDHAGCRHPVERFWVSSMTDTAIRDGWQRLQPGAAFDALADAARCRSEADWLVGMNATRALTCRTREEGGDALWSVGRVQTPTLAMIVARDRAIEAFVPDTYWKVEAGITAAAGAFKATWFREGRAETPRDGGRDRDRDDRDDAPHEERLGSAEDARAVVDAAAGQEGTVQRVDRRTRRDPPPLLYDLTALQRRANQRYGLSAQKTLELAQALYERHKLLTYPRTDARHLTSDQVATLPGVLGAIGQVPVYAEAVAGVMAAPIRPSKRWVDDAEVGDHHAIIPTDRPATTARLNPDEKRLYDLVARRLLAALSPDAIIDLADVVVAVPPRAGAALPADVPTPLTFRAKGRVVRERGWQAIDPPAARKDADLPAVQEGDRAVADPVDAVEGQTRPPRPYDDASMLKAMETAGRDLDDAALARAMRQTGLGTPATRAAILQTLLDRSYVVREGKALRATPAGCALVDAVPTDVLKSAELTGRWEARLARMAEGREERPRFMHDVAAFVTRVVDEVRASAVPEAACVRTRPEPTAVGACPVCGAPVRPRGNLYTCDTGRTCPFVVFGTMSGRAISKRMVKQLLTERRTAVVKGFKSRAGKAFDAALVVQDDGRVGFAFDDAPTPTRASEPIPAPAAAPAPGRPDGLPCPACGEGTILRGHAAWGCSRWRAGCGWRLPFAGADGVPIGDAEAARRVLGGASR
ncbi:MAG: DNA topoisomerase 3 [Alphaproteobacteria bacterium]|nr:DNA topoisomerase 3 [Alphaproteobacteria bacterium]